MVAQMVARFAGNDKVPSSNPGGSISYYFAHFLHSIQTQTRPSDWALLPTDQQAQGLLFSHHL